MLINKLNGIFNLLLQKCILERMVKDFLFYVEFKKLNIVTWTSKPAKTYQNVFK